MKKLLPLLLAMALLLSACSARDPLKPMEAPAPAESAAIPAPQPDADAAQPMEATLWFRFGTEPLLAPESRRIPVSPTTPWELALMQALLSGPAAGSTELSGLFPPGTRVTATHRQGRLIFVTLSRHIMNAYADEPEGWLTTEAWQEEIPLRRRLAMQAIAATLTENCDADQVVILVESSGETTDSLRLRQSYYRTGGDDAAIAAPLTRDESLLLSPQTAMATILQCWLERNWPRLYLYIARTDPATGLERPEYAAFAEQMAALPHLTDFAFAGGNVSHDGQFAAFTLDATLMHQGQSTPLEGGLIRLCLERGIWRIGLSQLTDREVSAR